MAIAEQAMQVVLEQLSGNAVSECQVLAAQFISRESCGCNVRSARSASVHNHPTRRDWRTEFERVGRVFAEDPSAGDVRRLLDAAGAQLGGEAQAFLSAVDALLREAAEDNEYHQRLQGSITRLREELRDVAPPELEDLWHDARTRIALVSTQTQVQLRLEHDEMYHRLIEHGERLNKARDLASLKSLLEETLPGLGVTDASISRVCKPDASELELFVGLKKGVPYQSAELRFSAHDLFPSEAKKVDRRRTWLLLPLVFETHNLGLAAFEYSRQMSSGWQVIRDQISAALRSLALHDEIVENTTRHERSIQEQERVATAKRIQSLSVLAGGVAHDLNNVLGPLVALPDVILQELQKFASDPAAVEVRSDVETIRSAALRAAQTITDLLTLSRQGQAAKEPVELNRIVADCISQDGLRLSAERKPPLSIELELFDEPLCVCASASHLTRAIANLLRNAAEAIPGEGVIHIRTQRVRLARPLTGYETVEAGEYAALVVSDSGNGIPESEIGRIFEPFFSSKKLGDDSGSGLGLAIVHGVVKEHGGFINVESARGRGTTFTLYFPTIAVAPIAPAHEVQPHRGQAKVLVVDDEPVQLRTARRILTVLGYRVDTLRSGVEAYRLFDEAQKRSRHDALSADVVKSPYELIILDMMLGEERDGLEVLQDIVRLFPSQRAIIASGHASTERTTAAVSRAVLWLPKPYTSSALARAVEEALSSVPGRRSAPPSAAHRGAASASKSHPPSSTE
jgi:signal transduction histidine kinase/ActR/RegA family two-component response regulator